MEKQQFKYVKGKVSEGAPADIYFFTDVDYWSVNDFIMEFNRLVEIGVSRINVHINSCGGAVVDGMSVFSRIIDCKVPTACYNDGLAASMASIIWAAGQEVYMKDYALLMIHNPFFDDSSGKAKYDQITDAFKKQLKVIYRKRFGLSDDEIEQIMNGEEGNDGTFLTAEEAVGKGFISSDHVIETPAAAKDKVSIAVKGGCNLKKLKAVMNELSGYTPNIHFNNNRMNNENEITVFAALLGMTGKEASVECVSARISEIKDKAEKYDGLKAVLDKKERELADMQTELAGSKASVKNLTTDLDKAKAELKKYQDAEAEAQKQRIDSLVEEAINACKIDKADKETWVNLAQSNFELAKNTLAKIPAREDISKQIAHDEKDVKDAQEGLKSEEEKLKAKVDEVVGKEFHFRKME